MPEYPILLPPLYQGGELVEADTITLEVEAAAPLLAIGVLGQPVATEGQEPKGQPAATEGQEPETKKPARPRRS